MYKKGAGNDKQGKDAGNRTLRPYRNFSQAIKLQTKDECALPSDLISLIFLIDVKELKSNKCIEFFLDKLLSWILPVHQHGDR